MRSAENPFRFDPVGKLMPSAEYDMRQTLPPQRPKTRYFLLRRVAPLPRPPVAVIHGEKPAAGRGTASCADAAAATTASCTATAATAAADSGSSSVITCAGAAADDTKGASQCAAGASPAPRGAAANDADGQAHSTAQEWVDLDQMTVQPFESQRCPDRQADGGLVVLAVRGERFPSTRMQTAPENHRTAASALRLLSF